MKAVTPADLTNQQVSPLTPLCRPGIPTSTTQAARRSLCQSPQRWRLFPGFVTNEQARHRLTPNQVRPPTDCRFTSGCSPPRLTATQLPSITEPTTRSGADLHHAAKASSRTHSFPRTRRAVRGKSCGRITQQIDPRISSWPGLSRLSTPSGARNKDVDARIKSAHDDLRLISVSLKSVIVADIISPDSPALARE